MHFYPFNPSAYYLSTGHWSEDRKAVECEAGLLRDLAYRRLLDMYYGEEAPIPSKTRLVAIRIRMLKHEEIVASVLKEKFELVDGAWRQNRADEEVSRYQRRAAASRENGKKGGRPRTNKEPKKTQQDAGRPQLRNRTRTTNPPLPPEGVAWFEEFWNLYPRTEGKPAAVKAFAKALAVAPSFEAIMAGLRRYIACDQWTDATKIPHASTWLNREGWNDIPPSSPVKGLNGDTAHWWDGRSGYLAKGIELNLPAPADDTAAAWYDFMASVWVALGEGAWLDETSLAYPRYKKLIGGE